MLTFANLPRPKNLHEIARPGLVEIIEIWAKPQLVKKTCGAGPIRIPPSPYPLAIALVSNDKLFESGEIEMKLSPSAQALDRSDEHKIGCA